MGATPLHTSVDMSHAQAECPGELVRRLGRMGRGELIKTLRGLHCAFRLDFTDEYLKSMSVERLRHVILAAGLHAVEARRASA